MSAQEDRARMAVGVGAVGKWKTKCAALLDDVWPDARSVIALCSYHGLDPNELST